MDDTQIKTLADMFGETNKSDFPAYNIPTIQFNGNTGEFRKVTIKDKVKDTETIKLPLEIVILHKRSILSKFKSKRNFWFTDEYEYPNQFVSLLHRVEDKTTLEKTGAPTQLREEDAELKTQARVYVLYKGEVCKLAIKGSSLRAYWEYIENVERTQKKKIYSVTTSIKTEERVNEANGGNFYSMTFEEKPLKVDFEVLKKAVEDSTNALNAIREYKNAKVKATPTKADVEEESSGDIPF